MASSQYDVRNIRTNFIETAVTIANPDAAGQSVLTPVESFYDLSQLRQVLSYNKECKFRTGVSIGLDSYFISHNSNFDEPSRRPVFCQIPELEAYAVDSRFAFVFTNDSGTNMSGAGSYTIGGDSELPSRLTFRFGLMNLQNLNDTSVYNFNVDNAVGNQPSQHISTVFVRLYITTSYEPNTTSIAAQQSGLLEILGSQMYSTIINRGGGGGSSGGLRLQDGFVQELQALAQSALEASPSPAGGGLPAGPTDIPSPPEGGMTGGEGDVPIPAQIGVLRPEDVLAQLETNVTKFGTRLKGVLKGTGESKRIVLAEAISEGALDLQTVISQLNEGKVSQITSALKNFVKEKQQPPLPSSDVASGAGQLPELGQLPGLPSAF